MDKQQLSQLKFLTKEIEMLKGQIENIDFTIETDTVKGSSPYFPYAEHNILITGIDYKNYERRIKRLRLSLNNRIDEMISLVEEINSYIEDIDSSEMRQILTLRFINGLTWQQIAFSIGYQDESVPRKRCERFLK